MASGRDGLFAVHDTGYVTVESNGLTVEQYSLQFRKVSLMKSRSARPVVKTRPTLSCGHSDITNRAQPCHPQNVTYVHSEHCARNMHQLLFSTDMLEAYLDVEEVDEIRMNVSCIFSPPLLRSQLESRAERCTNLIFYLLAR
jgi:hypothetical protein